MSATQIWIGRKPCRRNSARYALTRSRDDRGAPAARAMTHTLSDYVTCNVVTRAADVECVDGLPLPLIISAGKMSPESGEVLPEAQELKLAAGQIDDQLFGISNFESICEEAAGRVGSASNDCPTE